VLAKQPPAPQLVHRPHHGVSIKITDLTEQFEGEAVPDHCGQAGNFARGRACPRDAPREDRPRPGQPGEVGRFKGVVCAEDTTTAPRGLDDE